MTAPEEAPFLDRLETLAAEAAVRERQSARFLTLCLLATLVCMAALVLLGTFAGGDVYVHDTYFVVWTGSAGWPEISPSWVARLLPWAVVLCYGVLGAAALLHFAVFRRRAQQLRRQRSQALLIQLEEAVARRAAQRPRK